jgi:hypothetical protein
MADMIYVDKFGRASSNLDNLKYCPHLVDNCWVAFEDWGYMYETRCTSGTFEQCYAYNDSFKRMKRMKKEVS